MNQQKKLNIDKYSNKSKLTTSKLLNKVKIGPRGKLIKSLVKWRPSVSKTGWSIEGSDSKTQI